MNISTKAPLTNPTTFSVVANRYRNVLKSVGFLLIALLSLNMGHAQLSLTNASNTATINFSNTTPTTVGTNTSTAYTGAGFSANPTNSNAGRLNSNAWAVSGWSDGALAFGAPNTAGDYARGVATAAVTTGGFYAYTGSPASAANPIFIIQPGGGDFAPGTLTLRIQNNGTSNITSIDVDYNLYIRNDQARSNSFNFSYSINNSTYLPVSSLDYTSTAAAGVNIICASK